MGKRKLAYSGQRREGIEEDGTGSQGPQGTVVLEEEKEENKQTISSVGQAAFRILWT